MPRRSRSRSRSPRRDRPRDRSRERVDRRERDRPARRDYERPEREDRGREDRGREDRGREDRGRDRGERYPRRSRSPDRGDRQFKAASGSSGPSKPPKEEVKRFTAEDFAGKTSEEIEMMKLMGFGGFDTTKGKKVEGNDSGAVHVKLKRTYRQYMNRRGGFNRPLDAVH